MQKIMGQTSIKTDVDRMKRIEKEEKEKKDRERKSAINTQNIRKRIKVHRKKNKKKRNQQCNKKTQGWFIK